MPEEPPQPNPPFMPPGKPGGFKPPAPKLKPSASGPSQATFSLRPKPPAPEKAPPPLSSQSAAPPLFSKPAPKLTPKPLAKPAIPSMVPKPPSNPFGSTTGETAAKLPPPFKPAAPTLAPKAGPVAQPELSNLFQAAQPARASPPPPPEVEEDEDDLDSIFKEELESYLPEWLTAFDSLASELDNEDAWKEIKSRFHAIKGAANTVGRTEAGGRAAEAETLALKAVEFAEHRLEENRRFLYKILEELCAPLDLEVPALTPPAPPVPVKAETPPAPPAPTEKEQPEFRESPEQTAFPPTELVELLQNWQLTPGAEARDQFLDQTRTFRDQLEPSLAPLSRSFSQLLEFCAGVPEQPPAIFFSIIGRALDDACLYLEARRTDSQLPWSRKWGFYFSSLQIALASASGAEAGTAEDTASTEKRDPDMVEAFTEEAGESLEPIEQALLAWENGEAPAERQAELRRHYHTLKGAANSVGLPELGADFHILEDAMERTDTATAGETMLPLLFRCLDDVRDYLRLLESDPDSPWPGRWKKLFGGEPPSPDEETSKPAAPATKPTPKPAERQMLRVEAGQLQELMHLISELVADQSKISEAVDQLRHIHRNVAEEAGNQMGQTGQTGAIDSHLNLRELALRLEKLHKQLSHTDQSFRRTAKRIQSDLVELNMGPVGALFNRLSRSFRDACKEEQKEARWIAEGADVQLDRAVVDQLYGPLLHVVRNAVAHGIEAPETRRAAGKDPSGSVTIRAHSRADHVLIEISDDGAGINEEAIRRKAIERGLLEESVSEINQEQAIEILFSPGFSTKETVTNVAGRGVGLDVVKGDIEGLNGSVGVSYERGKGTTWQIRVPLTLSASEALLVMAGDRKLAIPLAMVDQCIRLKAGSIADPLIDSIEVAGETLRCLELNRFLGGEGSVPPTHAVLIDSGLARAALAVTGLVTRREIVVKDPGPILAKLSLFGGMTSDTDGSLIPVLQVPWILEWIHKKSSMGSKSKWESNPSDLQEPPSVPAPPARPEMSAGPVETAAKTTAEPAPPPQHFPGNQRKEPAAIRSILLADDSPSVRKVQEKELKRLGFEITLAKNGAEALDAIRENAPDLLITDWEMPLLNGHDLIRSVREIEELARLPIVVISSKVNEAFESEAREIGATACLAKPFQANQFLRLVQSLPEIREENEKRRDANGEPQA